MCCALDTSVVCEHKISTIFSVRSQFVEPLLLVAGELFGISGEHHSDHGTTEDPTRKKKHARGRRHS